MFGDVVPPGAIWIVPVPRERFSKDGVEGLLDTRGFDMPSGEVEFGHGHEALDRVVNLGHREEGFGVSHEVRDALKHGSRLEDERREGDTAQVGAGSQLGDDVGEDGTLLLRYHGFVLILTTTLLNGGTVRVQ